MEMCLTRKDYCKLITTRAPMRIHYVKVFEHRRRNLEESSMKSVNASLVSQVPSGFPRDTRARLYFTQRTFIVGLYGAGSSRTMRLCANTPGNNAAAT